MNDSREMIFDGELLRALAMTSQQAEHLFATDKAAFVLSVGTWQHGLEETNFDNMNDGPFTDGIKAEAMGTGAVLFNAVIEMVAQGEPVHDAAARFLIEQSTK